MPPEIVVSSAKDLARAFAERVTDLARGADRFSLALPGGSVAEAFCPVLAEAGLDWRRIDLFWCDERAVAPDHPDSNFRIAEAALVGRVDLDPARVHRVKGESIDLERAAVEYEAELRNAAHRRHAWLDMALVGVGPDGHVCSLFSGHPALEERVRLAVAITDSPKPPPRRVTLTLPALARTFLVVAAFGASKARAIEEALKNPESPLPVARAVRGARQTLFLLDEEAAGQG